MSKPLTLLPADARTIYGNSNDVTKKFMEEKLGKEFLKEDLWEIIKSFEDALAYKNMKAEDVLSVVAPYNKPNEISMHGKEKIEFIADIFRGDWKADPANHGQYKYFPYFIYKSGSGLSFVVSGFALSAACVAARQQFPTNEMSDRFGKQFIQYYIQMFLNK